MGKKILIVDNFGNDAPEAARLLAEKGYTDVNVLFNGLDLLESLPHSGGASSKLIIPAGCTNKLITRTVKYEILPADEFDIMSKKDKNLAIVDVRTMEEFNNQSKQYWRNVGHIRDAVNIPLADIEKRSAELGDNKSRPIVLYHFSGGSSDPYAAARKLADMGYQKVYVLSGGVFNLRWRAANIKGESRLKDYVVDVPADNL